MRRNLQLILKILEAVEALPADPKRGWSPFSLKDFPEEEVLYHARLCTQAGFVKAGSPPYIRELTWAGHEKLDELRNNAQ